jgi:hypothetical protein
MAAVICTPAPWHSLISPTPFCLLGGVGANVRIPSDVPWQTHELLFGAFFSCFSCV